LLDLFSYTAGYLDYKFTGPTAEYNPDTNTATIGWEFGSDTSLKSEVSYYQGGCPSTTADPTEYATDIPGDGVDIDFTAKVDKDYNYEGGEVTLKFDYQVLIDRNDRIYKTLIKEVADTQTAFDIAETARNDAPYSTDAERGVLRDLDAALVLAEAAKDTAISDQDTYNDGARVQLCMLIEMKQGGGSPASTEAANFLEVPIRIVFNIDGEVESFATLLYSTLY
jgi:hypothetical protein